MVSQLDTVNSTFPAAELKLRFQNLAVLLQFSRQPVCDFACALLIAVPKLLWQLPPGLRIPIRAENADEIPEFFGSCLPNPWISCLGSLAMQ
jgi:hypothetical protein